MLPSRLSARLGNLSGSSTVVGPPPLCATVVCADKASGDLQPSLCRLWLSDSRAPTIVAASCLLGKCSLFRISRQKGRVGIHPYAQAGLPSPAVHAAQKGLFGLLYDKQKAHLRGSSHELDCRCRIGNDRKDFSRQLVQKELQLGLCVTFFDLQTMNSVSHFGLLFLLISLSPHECITPPLNAHRASGQSRIRPVANSPSGETSGPGSW